MKVKELVEALWGVDPEAEAVLLVAEARLHSLSDIQIVCVTGKDITVDDRGPLVFLRSLGGLKVAA